MNQLNFKEFETFQNVMIPERYCMIWAVKDKEEFDRLINHVNKDTETTLPSSLLYYLCTHGYINEQETEAHLARMFKESHRWIYNLAHIISFADRINEDTFLIKRLKQYIPTINKWFLHPSRFESQPWKISVHINKTNIRTFGVGDYIATGTRYFNERNPDTKLQSEFAVLPGRYEQYATDYAKGVWETLFSEHMSWETYWGEFNEKEIKYYRYTVYFVLGGKLKELFGQETPYSLEEYCPETKGDARYGKDVYAERFVARVINILAHYHPDSIDIDAINNFFYTTYENPVGLNVYINFLHFLIEYKKYFGPTIPSSFLNIERMSGFLKDYISKNAHSLDENTLLRINGLINPINNL